MHIRDALKLVRSKYLDEKLGCETEGVKDKYEKAFDESPATMNIAHIILATKVAKEESRDLN